MARKLKDTIVKLRTHYERREVLKYLINFLEENFIGDDTGPPKSKLRVDAEIFNSEVSEKVFQELLEELNLKLKEEENEITKIEKDK